MGTNGGWDGGLASPDRVQDDLYPTPAVATQHLLKRVSFKGAVWECASGLGHISFELQRAGYEFVSTDLAAKRYGYGEELDFLQADRALAPNICTNPPYKLLRDFIEKCLTIPGIEKVALFLPFPVLPSVGLKRMFDRLGHPNEIIAMVPSFEIWMGEPRGWQTSFFKHAWIVWDRTLPPAMSSTMYLDDWRTYKP